jgi:MFS family permease
MAEGEVMTPHDDPYVLTDEQGPYDFDRTSSVSSIMVIDNDDSDAEGADLGFQGAGGDRKRGVSEYDDSYGSTTTRGQVGAAPAAAVSVLSPTVKKLFIAAVLMQLVNSMDRGIIPGSLKIISEDLDLSTTETGSLNSAFLGGVVLGIPVATVLANMNKIPPFQLVSFGMWIWIACVVFSAFSWNYESMLSARVLTGIGDACFQVICIPFIDENAPVEHRGKWMSLFIATYPIGIAIGTGVSGVMGTSALTWRATYFLEAILMFPLTLVPFFVVFHAPNSDLDSAEGADFDSTTRLLGKEGRGSSGSPSKQGQGPRHRSFVGSSNGGGLKAKALTDSTADHGMDADEEQGGNSGQLTEREALMGTTDSEGNAVGDVDKKHWRNTVLPVLVNPLCILACLAYAGLMAVSSGFGYWAIYYAEKTLGADARTAATGVALLTVCAAFSGTISGGVLLDRLGKKLGGKSCALTSAICATGSLLCIPFGFLAIQTDNVYQFFAFATLSIFFMLLAGTSFPLVILWTVSLEERVTASAVASFVTNLAGTVPAPIVVGWLTEQLQTKQEKVDDVMPKLVMYSVFSWMLWPVLLISFVGVVAKAKGIGANVDKGGK